MRLNLLRLCETNIGDRVASPLDYFDLGPHVRRDVRGVSVESLGTGPIILGGGGVVVFDQEMDLLSPHAERIIPWGIGCNELSTIFRPAAYPSWLGRCPLVGVRDWGSGFPWVPCASCMSPLFDQVWPITHEVGIYEHWEHRMRGQHSYKLCNDATFPEAIAFLGSCETVITNSYHGAYWATLLGKRVMVEPLNTKLYHFRHQPFICANGHWNFHLARARSFPTALGDCRSANRDHASKYMRMFLD